MNKKQGKLRERLTYFIPEIKPQEEKFILVIPLRATTGFKPDAVSDTIRNLMNDKSQVELVLDSYELVENDYTFNYKLNL